jgi:hypothetical protein
MHADGTVAFLVCAGAGLFWVILRIDPSQRGRVRRVYCGRSLGILFSNSVAVSPFWIAVSWLFAAVVVVPRPLGFLLAVLGGGAGVLGIALSYRVPAPFLPGWLRSEIDAGLIDVARPSRWDWVTFWLLIPLMTSGLVALVALSILYPSELR